MKTIHPFCLIVSIPVTLGTVGSNLQAFMDTAYNGSGNYPQGPIPLKTCHIPKVHIPENESGELRYHGGIMAHSYTIFGVR